jgi:hypothetical protein
MPNQSAPHALARVRHRRSWPIWETGERKNGTKGRRKAEGWEGRKGRADGRDGKDEKDRTGEEEIGCQRDDIKARVNLILKRISAGRSFSSPSLCYDVQSTGTRRFVLPFSSLPFFSFKSLCPLGPGGRVWPWISRA